MPLVEFTLPSKSACTSALFASTISVLLSLYTLPVMLPITSPVNNAGIVVPLPLSRTLAAPLLAYISPVKSPTTSPVRSPVTLPVTGPVKLPVTSAVIFPDAALRSILPRTSILKNFDVPDIASTLPSNKPTNLSEAVMIPALILSFK